MAAMKTTHALVLCALLGALALAVAEVRACCLNKLLSMLFGRSMIRLLLL